MSNNGTSNRIKIGGEEFTVQIGMKISPIDGDDIEVKPPNPLVNGQISEALYNYQNPYRDFAFSKISYPDYGDEKNVARLTGLPANEPDYVADFHFIALMRCIDFMLQHRYSGKIIGTYDTPGAQ